VREAIQTMFNFEWINATLFHGVEARAASFWERSTMRAEGVAAGRGARRARAAAAGSAAGSSPISLTADAVVPFAGEAAQRDRTRQRRALALLEEAGWRSRAGG
jgi:microcin C transport system substrate-binding protein